MPYGTSIHQGRIRRATALYAAAKTPVAPETTRDVVCNNLDHYADSMAQHRVAWAPATSSYVSKSYLTPRTSSVTVNTWYQIMASAPFPLSLRADGSSYKMRVRLGGASSGGHAVKFGIVLGPVLSAAERIADTVVTSDSVFITATTTSATAAWLTGASQGSGAYTTMVTLSAPEVLAYMEETGTPVDLSGARSAVEQCLVSVVVFGSTANTGSVPRLYGVIAEEWVG